MRRLSSGAAAVWVLGASQIIGYGTLYYAYAILAPKMAREFGWPLPWIFGLLSAALLASGAISPFAGRCLDRYGPATVMAWGSAAASASLLLVASAPNAALFAVGVVMLELCSPFVLYNAAFAYLAERAGANARRRIVHLTLIAGFASTIFWPLTASLLDALSWREIYGLYAALHLLVGLPLHLWLRRPARESGHGSEAPSQRHEAPEDAPLPPHLHARALWLVALGFALSGFLFSAISMQMVPLLASMGFGAASVLVASLFGPAQVLVRFANMAGASERHPIEATLVACALLPIAAVVLAVTAPAVLGAGAFAILLGFGSGLTSIVRGTLPLALFGKSGYGSRLGRISAAQLVSSAAAPVALSLLIEGYGSGVALGVMAAVGTLGFLAFVAVAGLRAKRPPAAC